MQPSIVWSQSATYLVVSAKLSNMQKTLVSIKCLCNCHSTSAVVGNAAFEKQVRKGYKLQNCSGHYRMSSFLKDPQCVAVRTGEHGSKTAAVLPLTQRVDRLQNCHIFLSSDEPCWQSCAARGRPRLSYREEHRNAPVKLAAAQSGPWHRPANYRPPQLDSATNIEYPDRGHTRGTQKKQTN